MSDLDDIVAVGLDLEPGTLIQAYSQGIFPWPMEGVPLLWHFPKKRAVLDFADLHLPRRLRSFLKSCPWTFTVDHAFPEVIEACSHRGASGTWIIPEMKTAYTRLHELGHAHSIEVWNGSSLIGGVYGVDLAGYFAGESMFHRTANASKAALLYAIALQKQAGREWMDIQVISPHMEAFGAREIPREEFQRRLQELRRSGLDTRSPGPFLKKPPVGYGSFSMIIE